MRAEFKHNIFLRNAMLYLYENNWFAMNIFYYMKWYIYSFAVINKYFRFSCAASVTITFIGTLVIMCIKMLVHECKLDIMFGPFKR